MIKLKAKWDQVPITIKVSLAYAICSILQKCLSFITLPLFTRLLTKEQYGQLTIYQSWSGILSIFLTLNLAYGSFSTAMVKFEKDREGYISAAEGICLVLSIVFLIVYLPLQELFNKLFELPTFIMCLMVVELLGVTGLQLWSGKKRFEFKYIGVVGVTLGMSVMAPTIAYFMVHSANEKGYARIIGYSIVSVVVGGLFFLRNVIKGKKIFDRGYWKYTLDFNIPLIAYYFSQVIFNQSDRIMISHMEGKDKAALYGVAYSMATVLTFVLNAINNSYVPWYYGKIKNGKQDENKNVSIGLALIMIVLLSGVIWFAPEIIEVLAGKDYVEAVYVVPPVAISILLLLYSQFFINVEFYYEDKKRLIGASIGAAVVNVVLNWFFIRWLGFVAAAYTTLVSYIIFAYCNSISMKKMLREKGIADNSYNYKALLILFLLFCVASAIGSALYGVLVARILIAVAIFVVVFIKRKYFINLIKSMKDTN